MTTIAVKDGLRQSVEAASGGKQTVIFTNKGQASFMNVITKKMMNELYPTISDTSIHPAFSIKGKVANKILIGTYPGSIVNGELLSIPWQSHSYVGTQIAMAAAISAGAGHHILTGTELSLIKGLMNKDNFIPYMAGTYGVNLYGAASVVGKYAGVRQDGKPAGDLSSPSVVLTGSGPVQYRMGNDFSGITDIHFGGNTIYGGVAGFFINGSLRVLSDEVQVLADNTVASRTDLNWSSPSYLGPEWKAIDATTGELKEYTYTGTPGNLVATTPNSIRMANPGVTNLNPSTTIQIVGTWAEGVPANFAGIGSLTPAARKTLTKYGILAPDDYTKGGQGFMGTVNTSIIPGNIHTSRLQLLAGPWNLAVTTQDPLLATLLYRPAYYADSDLV